MNIFNDYLSFKEDKYDLLNFLADKDSNIIVRFKHVIIVVDFLYDKYCSNVTLDKDEEQIFDAGFNYIFVRINLIDMILTRIFNNKLTEMEDYSKTINLILYTNDFIDEVTVHDESNRTAIDELSQYEGKILKLLENKEHATDIDFAVLDKISTKIFDDMNIEYYGLNEIFYDVALELGIIDEDDEGIEFEI